MARLPQELTAAYTKIVSLRISGEKQDGFEAEIKKVERLGRTYLSLLLSGQREDFQALAFVAASAYSLVTSYQTNEDRVACSQGSLCPMCISALLFIIADATSDAAEVATTIQDDMVDQQAHALITQIIRNLSLGRLWHVVFVEVPDLYSDDPVIMASNTLYRRCLIAVQELCKFMLGREAAPVEVVYDRLERIKELCVYDFGGGEFEAQLDGPIYSTFPGPFILSSLLLLAAKRLVAHSVMTVISPYDHLQVEWGNFLRRLALKRPYLWPNHYRMIHDYGLLVPGVSAVLSLPTGAGKTTLSNLKMASALMGGGKAVFLAPTHALVQQVADELQRAFPEHSVRNAIIDGEYVETEDSEFSDIAVMTPERCLAFLMFYPEVFAQVKLVVFDECHILHAGDWGDSYRASDSMMCLLRLLDFAPDADYLLLSAMVENGEDIAGWLQESLGRTCHAIQDEWKPTRQVKGCVVYQATDIKPLREILFKDKVAAWQTRRKSPGAAVKRQLNVTPWGFFGLNQNWLSGSVQDYTALPVSDKPVTLTANKYWKLSPNKNGSSTFDVEFS